MSVITYRQAIKQALSDELASDSNVFLLGEDIGAGGGVFKVTEGLFQQFGPERVRDTPIAEQAIVGCAIGAALSGLRPVAEIMFADFAAVCFDQIVNQAAKYRYMTGGQVALPLTIRLATGGGAGFAAQHSQSAEQWFVGVPGLKIAAPSTVNDAYWLLRAAIRDPNPVLYFEHKGLYAQKGLVAADGPRCLGGPQLVEPGRDITLVAGQQMLAHAITAARNLRGRDVQCEVIDIRVLRPFQADAINDSVSRTGRLLVVQEAPFLGSWGASLVAYLASRGEIEWRAPPRVLGSADTPVPYAAALEASHFPDVARIERAVLELVGETKKGQGEPK